MKRNHFGRLTLVFILVFTVSLMLANGLNPVAGQASCLPVVDSAKDIGSLSQPKTVTARDEGASALIGNNLLWAFSDTLFTPKAVDGANLRSSTAALAKLSAPLVLQEPTDTQGAPAQFLPFTTEEQHYNDQSGKPDDRIALWPSSIISEGDHGLVFYLKLKIKPGFLNYEFLGSGIAEVSANQTVAKRDPSLLFIPPEPLFDEAALIGSDVYLFGGLDDSTTLPDAIARVPLSLVRDRSAYRFWDGSAWNPDVKAAKAVLKGVPGTVSLSYNTYLKRYIAVHSVPVSNNIVMNFADAPQGPWSDAIVAFAGLQVGDQLDYAGREHPELATDQGRTITISYYHPLGGFRGEIRLVQVTFKTNCASS